MNKGFYESPSISRVVVFLEKTIATSGDVSVNGNVNVDDYTDGGDISGDDFVIKW